MMKENVKIYFRNEDTTDIWLTPIEIVKALGDFDLDPCSPVNAPWRLTPLYYTIEHDGLKQPWVGRCFVNPPYGRETKHWLKKCSEYKNCTALIFARVETQWFKEFVWDAAHSIFFFHHRITFHKECGAKGQSASAPSCLISYNIENTEAIKNSNLNGKLIIL